LTAVARPPFEADGTGAFRVHLRPVEREVLRRLPAQAIDLLDAKHPATARLFPPTYPDDPRAEAELSRAVGSELADGHRRALTTFVSQLDARRLDEDQLTEWVHALEVLRLVLGTQLGVTEDMAEPPAGDPTATAFAYYQYLSALQDEAVRTLAAGLPEAGVPGADDLVEDPGDGHDQDGMR
jgi:hypothetical protein